MRWSNGSSRPLNQQIQTTREHQSAHQLEPYRHMMKNEWTKVLDFRIQNMIIVDHNKHLDKVAKCDDQRPPKN